MSEPLSQLQAVWIVARSGEQMHGGRIGRRLVGDKVSRCHVLPAACYTVPVRQRIMHTSYGGSLRGDGFTAEVSSADDYAGSNVWKPFGETRVGFALLRSRATYCILDVITSSELWARDFWRVAEEGFDSLMFVDVVDILPLASPTTIYAKGSAQGSSYGCAWEITDHSLATIVASTPGLLEKAHEWQGVHRCNL